MSAILGRIEYGSQALDKSKFDRAFKALSDYGPDGKVTVHGQNYAFGLQYFGVRSGQSDSIELQRNGCTLVADAILDARQDLLDKLGLPPATEGGPSDLELIRSAFLKWGHSSPNQLFGDLAFAVFDPESRELFLARDHIGKRPLYWARGSDSFTFSTDISALIEFDDINREIDQKTLLRFMVREGTWPQPKTLLKGINFVDPGCYMTVSRSEQKQTRWWNPHDIKTVHGRSTQDCVHELAELLDTVIEDNIATDLPFGRALERWNRLRRSYRAVCKGAKVEGAIPSFGVLLGPGIF